MLTRPPIFLCKQHSIWCFFHKLFNHRSKNNMSYLRIKIITNSNAIWFLVNCNSFCTVIINFLFCKKIPTTRLKGCCWVVSGECWPIFFEVCLSQQSPIIIYIQQLVFVRAKTLNRYLYQQRLFCGYIYITFLDFNKIQDLGLEYLYIYIYITRVAFACTKVLQQKKSKVESYGEDISLFVSAFTFWKSSSLRHFKLLCLCQFHLWRVIVMVYPTNEKQSVDSII